MSKRDPDRGPGASRLHSTMQRPALGLPLLPAERAKVAATVANINKYIEAQLGRIGMGNSQIRGVIWKQVYTSLAPILDKITVAIEEGTAFYRADADALNKIKDLFGSGNKKAKTKNFLKDLPRVIEHLGQWLGTTPYSKALLDNLVGMARSKYVPSLVKAFLQEILKDKATGAKTEGGGSADASVVDERLQLIIAEWPFEKLQQFALAEISSRIESEVAKIKKIDKAVYERLPLVEKTELKLILSNAPDYLAKPSLVLDALFEGVKYGREEMAAAKREAIEAASPYRATTEEEMATLQEDIGNIESDLEKLSTPREIGAGGEGQQEYSGLLDQMAKDHGVGGGSKATESVAQDPEQGLIQECQDLKAQLEEVVELRKKIVNPETGKLKLSADLAKHVETNFLLVALNTDQKALHGQVIRYLTIAKAVSGDKGFESVSTFVMAVFKLVQKHQRLVSSHQNLLRKKAT